MDSLNEWFRYLDRVSRPARRASDDDPTVATEEWRPWRPSPGSDEPVEVVEPEAIPDLSVALGAPLLPSGFQPATLSFVDPTLDDKLQPMPQFSVPRLQPPKFDVSVPEMRRRTGEVHEVTSAPSLGEPGFIRGEPDANEAPTESWKSDLDEDGDPVADSSRAPRHWDLLFQIRSRDVAQNSYKSRFRETREELVQRLLDPSLTLEETARLLGVCPTTVRRYTNRGHLRHFRTSGNQRRFRLSDVLEFLENRASEIEADARADEEAGTTLDAETGLDD